MGSQHAGTEGGVPLAAVWVAIGPTPLVCGRCTRLASATASGYQLTGGAPRSTTWAIART